MWLTKSWEVVEVWAFLQSASHRAPTTHCLLSSCHSLLLLPDTIIETMWCWNNWNWFFFILNSKNQSWCMHSLRKSTWAAESGSMPIIDQWHVSNKSKYVRLYLVLSENLRIISERQSSLYIYIFCAVYCLILE